MKWKQESVDVYLKKNGDDFFIRKKYPGENRKNRVFECSVPKNPIYDERH